MSLAGSRVGRIAVRGLLGRGGKGEVYLGFDETLGRRVALKAIRTRERLDPDARARFLREARILSQLDHPNICKLHDYVTQDDADFLVLEHIEGRSLSKAIATGLEPVERLRIAEEIASALARAHAAGVVHRDLKPSNVMLTASGEVKILDFGLARAAGSPPIAPSQAADEPAECHEADQDPDDPSDASRSETVSGLRRPEAADPFATPGSHGSSAVAASDGFETRTGSILGTPAYMSPEQALAEEVTAASDMYSFGLLLQKLFTGKDPHPPWLRQHEILWRACAGATLPPDGAPRDVAALIGDLKSFSPAERPTAPAALARIRWIRAAPRRRARRLAAGALLLVAALGGIKYAWDLSRERALAVAAREEADRRRQQAEDLIQFMLGDLREKLEPVGRLELLDDVGDKALDYFASLSDADLTDEDLFRRSEALSQIGEVRIAQGDLAAAARSFEEAAHLGLRLVERDPSRGDWWMGLGEVEFWIGNVAWLQNDLDTAERRFHRYLEIAEKLVGLDPTRPDWRLEIAYGHSNLGTLLEARGDADGALHHFDIANRTIRELLAADPDDPELLRELADNLSWLGEARAARGDLAIALERFDEARRTLELLLVEDPENAQRRYLLGIAHNKVGSLQEDLGREADAAATFEMALSIHRELAARDPENAEWRREVAINLQRLGAVLARRGDPRGLSRMLEATRTLAELVDLDSSNAQFRRDLAGAETALATGLLAAGRVGEARLHAERAGGRLRPLLVDGTVDPRLSRLLAEADFRLAESEEALGRTETARELRRGVLGRLAALPPDARQPEVLALEASTLLALGRRDEASESLARLETSGYRGPLTPPR